MLDPVTAALASTQLGGLPQGRVVQTSLAFSNDGRWLAAGFIHPTQLDEDTWFRVWDTRNLTRPVAAFTAPFLTDDIAVSDDGTRVYAWEAATQSTRWTLPGRRGRVRARRRRAGPQPRRLDPGRASETGRSRCSTRDG